MPDGPGVSPDQPRQADVAVAPDGRLRPDAPPDQASTPDVAPDMPPPTPDVSPPPRALLVVGDDPPVQGDILFRNRLTTLGFQVRVLPARTMAEAVTARAAAAMTDLVVITSSLVSSSGFATLFRDLPAGLVCTEQNVLDDLGLIEQQGNNGTNEVDATQLVIYDAVRQIAPSVPSGTVTVVSTTSRLSGARPLVGAVTMASLVGSNIHSALFTYEQGASLAQGTTAAGRRVALFPRDTAVAALNDIGWAMVDAAFRWAARR